MKSLNNTPQPKLVGAGRAAFNRVWEHNPDAVKSAIDEAVKELFMAYGGRPDALTSELQTIEKGDRPSYAFALALTFDPTPEHYEVNHTGVVTDFYNDLKKAWLSSTGRHVPGELMPIEMLEHGTIRICLRHEETALMAQIINKMLRENHLPTVDTRLIAMPTRADGQKDAFSR